MSDRRSEISANLQHVQERIADACSRADRSPRDVTLIAVTKTYPVSDVRILCDLGVRDFGENRDQEARPKAAAFAAEDGRDVRWHFIGQLQSNKARAVVGYASMVHTVDRRSLLDALQRAAERPLDILLQLSIDGAPGRGGALLTELLDLASAVSAPLTLRGVMAVAPLGMEPAEAFQRVADAHSRLLEQVPAATVRCIGMSDDFEAAIAAGATHIRVGSALLGPRTVV